MEETSALVSAAEQQALMGLAVALAIGLLFGVERGWHRQQQPEESRTAGLRTFGLIGLLGGTAGLLSRYLTPDVLGWVFVGTAAIFATVYVVSIRHSGQRGSTSLIASLLTFGLGALAAIGEQVIASAAAVVATLLLGFKPQLHAWVSRIDEKELHATLKLLLITVVLLPILPDRGFGPSDALNPYQLWWMVVLIASISYVGYFAVRVAGADKGLLMTSLVAGLASSTALTVQLSRLGRQENTDKNLLAAGILIANATLFPRILVIVALVNTDLVPLLVPPLLLMLALTLFPSLLLWLAAAKQESGASLNVENPLELGMALRFGVLLAVIMLGGELAAQFFGNAGVLVLAAISGVADLNAITLSIAGMEDASITLQYAVIAILVAVLTNSLFKAGFSALAGTFGLGLRVGLPLIGTAAAGLALVWVWGGTLPMPVGEWVEEVMEMQAGEGEGEEAEQAEEEENEEEKDEDKETNEEQQETEEPSADEGQPAENDAEEPGASSDA